MRLVVFGGLFPGFRCSLLVNRYLHIVQKCYKPSHSQIEKFVVHLFKVFWLICVLARVVVEYFNEGELDFFRIVSYLLLNFTYLLLVVLLLWLFKLVWGEEKVNTPFIGYW